MTKPHDAVLRPSEAVSDVTALAAGAATITLSIDKDQRHWFAAVEFYDSAAADNAVEPTAGTATYTVETSVLPEVFQSLTNGSVDYVMANGQADWVGNATRVKVVLAGISGNGATHCRLRAVGNSS